MVTNLWIESYRILEETNKSNNLRESGVLQAAISETKERIKFPHIQIHGKWNKKQNPNQTIQSKTLVGPLKNETVSWQSHSNHHARPLLW